MTLDLDQVEAVINRPHVIDLRADGWTLMHPPACHPHLFECPVNQAATSALTERPALAPGRYECELDYDDEFAIGEPAPDAQGIDWLALVAELRVAREQIERLLTISAKFVMAYEKLANKEVGS